MLVDRERHFVQVPLVAASQMTPTKLACQQWAELAAPQPDGLVSDLDPTFGEQLLDIAVAEGEAVVQPDGVSDDLGWETVASDARCTALRLACPQPIRMLTLPPTVAGVLPRAEKSRNGKAATRPRATLPHSKH